MMAIGEENWRGIALISTTICRDFKRPDSRCGIAGKGRYLDDGSIPTIVAGSSLQSYIDGWRGCVNRNGSGSTGSIPAMSDAATSIS
jgi:hypothetical protein